MKILNQLDPRTHLGATIGWAVFLLVAIAALVLATVASRLAEERIRADTEQLLNKYATQIRQELAIKLESRAAIIQATAVHLEIEANWDSQSIQSHLDPLREQFPEFAWVGVANRSGTVIGSTGGLLVGTDVSARPWFQQGIADLLLGGVRRAKLLEDVLPGNETSEPLRFFKISVPLRHGDVASNGVLSAHLYWS